MPLYAGTFVGSLGLISVAVAAQPFGTMLADVPAGLVMARFGRRRMMLLGAAMVAISCLGLAQAHVFAELIVYRVVGGAGTSLWGISRLAFVADAVPVATRGRALSTFGGMQRIGTFVGPAAGGAIAATLGLPAAFLVAGLVGLVAVAVSFKFVRETASATSVGHRARWRLLGGVLRRQYKDLLGAGSAQVFAQMIRSGRQLIVPLYGANTLGLDVATVGTILSISALIDMSLFWPAGMMMDRLGRKYASIPSFVVMAAGMAMIPLAGGFLGLLAVTAVMGLGNGLGAGTMMTLGADLAPPGAAGEFLGLWRLVGDGGSLGGPLLVGAIADVLGLAPAALVLAGVGMLAGATIYIFVQETLQPPAAHAR
jgi:MFS family permease